MLTTANAVTQPARKTGPFTRARCENNIKITEMIGTGLIATPTAKVNTSLIPCPTDKRRCSGTTEDPNQPKR